MELEQILEAIKSLPEEDKVKVQQLLAVAPEEGELEKAQETAETDKAAEGTADTVTDDIVEDKEKGASGEQVAGVDMELVKATNEDAQADTEVKETEDIPGEKAQEPIPDMSKSAPAPTEGEGEIASEPASPPIEQAAPLLQDEQGGEMPIDYGQIVEGLNAKNLALESENKQLKAKIEGAFGLSSKPGAFAPVNNLYGDTADIPTMRK